MFSLDQRKQFGTDDGNDDAHHSHDRQAGGEGLQRFLFGHTAHFADHPETAIVHPRQRLGAAPDR